MPLDIRQERDQAHALLDLLPPSKVGAVRTLLEVMIDDGDALNAQDRAAIQAGVESLDNSVRISLEDVLSDLGLTMSDLARMDDAPIDAALQALQRFVKTGTGDVQQLEGFEPPVYRLRSGDWRIIFRYSGDDIDVVRVRNRCQA